MEVLPPVLRHRGYTRHGERYGVNCRKHLLHKYGDTPAFDVRAIAYWTEHDVQDLKVYLTDGRTMLASLHDFLHHARVIEHPTHGQQMVSTDPTIWTTVDERR